MSESFSSSDIKTDIGEWNGRAGSSSLQILYEKYKTVDLGRLGLISGSFNDLILNETLEAKVNSCMTWAVACSMLQGLGGGQTENALMVRELSPYQDLLDGSGNRIYHNQWIQTGNSIYSSSWYNKEEKVPTGIPIYQTGKEVKNDQKVHVIYGIEFLNGFKKVNAEEIQFWRKGIKLIDRININRNQRSPIQKGLDVIGESKKKKNYSILSNKGNLVYHNNMLLLHTPILFKKDDIMQIVAVYNPKDNDSTGDEIKIKGITCMALGMECMG